MRVEPQVELLVEGARKRRVQEGRAAQFYLEVATMAPDGERAQEHWRAEICGPVTPFGDADAEMNRINAATTLEFQALGGDRAGRDLCGTQCDIIPDQVR